MDNPQPVGGEVNFPGGERRSALGLGMYGLGADPARMADEVRLLRQALMALPGGKACAANQVHYSASARGVEWDLLPWQRRQGMPMMAYSPFDQGALVDHPALRDLALRHQAKPAQIALAWVLRQPGVMAVPKAGRALHLQLNWAAAGLALSQQDLADLDRSFAPPRRKQALSMR